MMRIIFTILLAIHGLIHVLGFAKAINPTGIKQLTKEISKPAGVLWLISALIFVAVTILWLLNRDEWWMVAIVAVVISQVLIFMAWQDAKFGTIANIIIIGVAFLAWGNFNFENSFRKDVRENLSRMNAISEEMLTEADLLHLPEAVKRYLRYTGAVNKPKVKNFRIVFEGEMRDKGKDYFPFISEQYNFFDEPTRLFFMKGKMFGIQVPGYHRYSQAKATMDIRLFGLFPVIRQAGEVMDTTETVTLFNDMCLMAPATLIDKRIQWQALDENAVIARFTNHGITITAVLYFNNEGQLVDFASKDRTAISDMKHYPFFTPVSDYKEINGRKVPTYGEAIWEYPDGKFTYGKFRLKEVEYNLR